MHRSASRAEGVVLPDIFREFRVATTELVGADREPGQHDVEEIGAAANMPQVASIQILIISRRRIRSSTERGMMNERPAGPPPAGEGNTIRSRGAGSLLHVVELGHALRRAGEAWIGGDVRDALAVDEDLAVVAQRREELVAGADGHRSSGSGQNCRLARGSAAAKRGDR